jgi:hypothetical protein
MSERIAELIERASQGLQLLRTARGGDRGGRSVDGRGLSEILGQDNGAISRVRSDVPARFSSSRTHKANSAESIVTHCLRQRGWSKRWREGRLTGRQHLLLLEDVRQYGRQWMRHEAEAFFGRYGADELGQSRGLGSFDRYGDYQGIGDALGRDEPRRTEGNGEITRSLSSHILPPLKRWFERNRGFIQELMYAAAQTQEGTHNLTPATTVFVDDLVQVQRDYLDQFYRDLQTRTPVEIANILGPAIPGIATPYTQGQVIARAESYGNAAWQGGQKVLRRRQKASGGMKWERRILGHPMTEHCDDCPPLAKLGWQPIGTLPDIGDTECGGRCYCHFEYSDSIEAPTGKAPPPAKPKEIPVTEEEHIKQVAQELYDKLKQGMKLKVVIGVGAPRG